MGALNQTYVVSVSIPIGQNFVVISGLSIPFAPLDATAQTESDASGQVFFATPDKSTLSPAGGTFNLSFTASDGNQRLIATFYGYQSPAAGGGLAAPGTLAASAPILYERAGEVAVGDFVGGLYVFDCPIQINRVSLTAMAPQELTVLDLVVGGILTGNQMVIPSGLPNTEIVVSQSFNPPLAIDIQPYGLTPQVRWQCTSGAATIAASVAQIDLLMWVQRLLAQPTVITPFSGGSLMSPALSEGNVEGAAQALFAEWLGDYFDGNTHMIGVAHSGVFPICDVKFEQGEIRQPLNQTDVNPGTAQTEIRLTMMRRPERRDDAAQGWLVTAPVLLNFWVRSKNQGKGQGAYLARTVSELLYSILQNPENTLALAEKGIKHLAPRGGVTIPSVDWSEKLVSCNGEFLWWVYFQFG